jgi:hypothetical protein
MNCCRIEHNKVVERAGGGNRRKSDGWRRRAKVEEGEKKRRMLKYERSETEHNKRFKEGRGHLVHLKAWNGIAGQGRDLRRAMCETGLAESADEISTWV